MRIELTPVPAPRQVRSDAWKPRPSVQKYRNFRDALHRAGLHAFLGTVEVTFLLPMPTSWTEAKKFRTAGQHHTQKPDIDNLVKALLDGLRSDDSHVHTIIATKRWDYTGAIELTTR